MKKYYLDEHTAAYAKMKERGIAAWDQYYDPGSYSFDRFMMRPFLEQALETAAIGGTGARALEYGCGTGAASCFLALRGFEVEGIDITPDAIELARRYARQFSASRAKKIIHYNVSASNISLNGAWMDLSGARIFSNLIGCDKLDVSGFLTEYEPTLRSIHDICHYLKKYEVIDAEFQGNIFQSAIDEFWDEYPKCLRFYNAVQVGFPGFFLSKVTGSLVFLEFSSCLQRLLDLGCYELVDRRQELEWKGYEYEMTHVYIHALKMKIFNSASDAFFAYGGNVSLINEFFCMYGRLFDLVVECVEREGIDRKCFTVAMAINVIRLNRRPYIISDLKDRLSKIERRVGLGGDPPFNSFERDVKHWSTLVFSCGADLKIPFWVGDKMRVFYDIASGVFVVKRCGGDIFIESLCNLWNEIEVGDVMSFYKNVWGILNEEF